MQFAIIFCLLPFLPILPHGLAMLILTLFLEYVNLELYTSAPAVFSTWNAFLLLLQVESNHVHFWRFRPNISFFWACHSFYILRIVLSVLKPHFFLSFFFFSSHSRIIYSFHVITQYLLCAFHVLDTTLVLEDTRMNKIWTCPPWMYSLKTRHLQRERLW